MFIKRSENEPLHLMLTNHRNILEDLEVIVLAGGTLGSWNSDI